MKPTWLGTCFFKLHFSKSFPFSLWTERKKMGKKRYKMHKYQTNENWKILLCFQFWWFHCPLDIFFINFHT